MNLLIIISSGALLLVLIGWLAWLTISLGRLQDVLRAGQERSRFTSKELERGTQQLDSLQNEFRRLARRVEQVEEKTAHRSPAPLPLSASPDRFTDAERGGQTPRDPTSLAPPGPTHVQARSNAPVTDRSGEIVSLFNALAASFDQSARDNFVSRFGPEQCAFDGAVFHPDSSGAFWVLETGIEGNAIVLPGGVVARDWDKFYRQMDGMHARQVLGECFEISEGGRLRIIAPAKGRRAAESYELVARGHLAGI